MNDNVPNLLDRLDQTPVPPLALDDLLTHARAVARRRRRAAVAGAVAATALVLGGGAVAVSALASPHERDVSPANGGSVPVALAVEITDELPAFAAVQVGEPVTSGIRAQWAPARGTLTYASGSGYSSTCPPAATATVGTGGEVQLVIRENLGSPGWVCTADATRVAVVIHGLTAPPSALRVTEGGRSEEVAIAGAPGGTDGGEAVSNPVVAHPEGSGGEGLQALIGGTLTLSRDCLLVGGYPVIWPHGTTWDAASRTVQLPDGQAVAVGDQVRGGGGYPYLSQLPAHLAEPLADCPTNEYGEIAMFNPGEQITVTDELPATPVIS